MKNKKTYSLFHHCSALGLIIALLWLTVSAPFVFNTKQDPAKQQTTGQTSPSSGCEEESSNPLGSSEEKSSVANNLSEEYLHNQERTATSISGILAYHPPADDGTYIAYHGELLVPPPDQS